MHSLVYVFGDDPIAQVQKFWTDNPRFVRRNVRDVYAMLTGRTSSRLSGTEDSLQQLPDAEILAFIRAAINEDRGPLVIVDRYDISKSQHQMFLDAGVYCIISFDENGRIEIVETVATEDMRTDWFVVGGRWRHYLQMRPDCSLGVTDDELESWECDQACNRAFNIQLNTVTAAVEKGSDKSGFFQPIQVESKYPTSKGRDQLPKKWIDHEKMLDGGEAIARKLIELRQIKKDKNIEDFSSIFDKAKHYSKAQEQYTKLYGDQDLPEDFPICTGWDLYFKTLDVLGRDKFIDFWRLRSFCPSAYVRDGQWVDLDWFFLGVEKQEENKKHLNKMQEFFELYKNLQEDTLVTVMDCHM